MINILLHIVCTNFYAFCLSFHAAIWKRFLYRYEENSIRQVPLDPTCEEFLGIKNTFLTSLKSRVKGQGKQKFHGPIRVFEVSQRLEESTWYGTYRCTFWSLYTRQRRHCCCPNSILYVRIFFFRFSDLSTCICTFAMKTRRLGWLPTKITYNRSRECCGTERQRPASTASTETASTRS